jgi:hypothetical protein
MLDSAQNPEPITDADDTDFLQGDLIQLEKNIPSDIACSECG